MSDTTVAITGASGFIGKALVQHFSSIGWHVRAFVRTVPERKTSNIDYFTYSISDKPSEKDFSGCDVIVHCAVQHKSKSNPTAGQTNIVGVKNLLEIARKLSIPIVFLSTLSAHSEAESEYGQNKLHLESLFDPKQDLILKLGLVLGKGGLFGSISQFIEKSPAVPIVGGNKPIQSIALDDLCRVIENGIRQKTKGVFHIAEPTVYSMKDMYSFIGANAKKKPTFIPLPIFVAELIALTGELVGLTLPVTSESVKGLKRLRSFDTAKDVETFKVPLKNMPKTIQILQG